jgi:hypothetical protein
LATTGAVLAVLVSFAAITMRWPGPRPAGSEGRPLPAGLQRLLESPLLRGCLRTVVLIFSVVVVVVAFTGPEPEGLNLAPYALYITFWVGLIPASLLLGPVWRVVNPLRLIHAGIDRVLRVPPGAGAAGPVAIPAWLGWWPAATWLAVFVWLELVYPERSSPQTVGTFLVFYAVVNLTAARFYGSAWFDRGDGFEAYSTLIAALSPLGRHAGRLVVRNPIDGVLGLRDEPGLLAAMVVLVGSTAFDGLTRTRFWVEEVPSDSIILGTAGLACMMLAILILYLATMVIADKLTERPSGVLVTSSQVLAAGDGGPAILLDPTESDHVEPDHGELDPTDGEDQWRRPALSRLPDLFAPTLVPIAVGYSIAHYASLFFYEGQGTWILLSDPYNVGANYLGTRVRNIDYTVISPTTVAFIQIGAIVLGHIVAVVVAHYRAVSLFDKATAKRSQYPLMVLMLFLTGMAVTLLINT